jgi:hypothetical protein
MINSQPNSHVGDRGREFTHRIVQEPGPTAIYVGDEVRPQLEVEISGKIKGGRSYEAVARMKSQVFTNGVSAPDWGGSASVVLDKTSSSVKLGFPILKFNSPGDHRLLIDFFGAENDGSAQLVPIGEITNGTISIKSRD